MSRMQLRDVPKYWLLKSPESVLSRIYTTFLYVFVYSETVLFLAKSLKVSLFVRRRSRHAALGDVHAVPGHGERVHHEDQHVCRHRGDGESHRAAGHTRGHGHRVRGCRLK